MEQSRFRTLPPSKPVRSIQSTIAQSPPAVYSKPVAPILIPLENLVVSKPLVGAGRIEPHLRCASGQGIALAALLTALGIGSSGALTAASLQVGPGKKYATIPAAVSAAANGDTIEIAAATYVGASAVAVVNKNLTLRGVGGRPVLDAGGYVIPNGKAIFVAAGPDIAVENLEFKNAAVPDHNGSGIRPEGAKLAVRSCYFHDNENGIQGGAPGSEILVESCEFEHNGFGDGQSHNLYINVISRFTFQFNYSHRGNIGHLLKTRAAENYILYNRITDESGGMASYEVDVPQGGLTYLVGNLIEQSSTTQNSTIVTFAEEGSLNPTNTLYLSHNTLVNDRGSGTFVRNAATDPALLVNNLFIGGGTVATGAVDPANNLSLTTAQLVNAAGYDYHLAPFSAAIDWGAAPGTYHGFDLTPVYEYIHPMSNAVRHMLAASDVGAYESTDPTSAFLHFTGIARTNGGLQLTWLANPALRQFLESGTSLGEVAWNPIATNGPGGAVNTSKFVPAANPGIYFRLRAVHP